MRARHTVPMRARRPATTSTSTSTTSPATATAAVMRRAHDPVHARLRRFTRVLLAADLDETVLVLLRAALVVTAAARGVPVVVVEGAAVLLVVDCSLLL